MAAPPLPPKGSACIWTGEKTFETHSKYRSNDHNTLCASSSDSQTIRFGFGTDDFQGLPEPPPLPPPRSVTSTLKQTKRYTSQISELSAVPPPGIVSFKPKKEVNNLIELSTPNKNYDISSSPFLKNISKSSHIVNLNVPYAKTLPVNSLGPSSISFLNGNSVVGNQSPLPFYNSSFSNTAYQSSVRHIPSHVNTQQSQSWIPGLSLPSNYVTNNSSLQNPLWTGKHALKSEPSQMNMEKVLRYMKKKRDSNLIDLYCGDDILNRSKFTYSEKPQDEILKLFDPLAEECDDALDENVPDTNKNVDCNTVAKEIWSLEDGDVNISLESTKSLTGDVHSALFIPKSEPHPFYSISSNFCASIVKIDMCNYCTNEIEDFCVKLKKMRSEFTYDDYPANVGFVISPTLDSYQDDSLSIKLIINSVYSERPVSFTCDVNTAIEHIISHTVCSVFEDTTSLSMDNFVLKVYGLSEYFTAHSQLVDYEYVHQCHKFDLPVCLTLTDVKDLRRPLARTKEDDYTDVDFKPGDIAPYLKKGAISYENLSILLETLEKEIEKIKSNALKSEALDIIYPQGVIQAVKAICTLLSHVEISEITDAVSNLIHVSLLFGKLKDESDFVLVSALSTICKNEGLNINNDENKLSNLFQLLELSLLHLQQAIQQLLIIYSKAFSVDFKLHCSKEVYPEKSVTDFLDTLLFQLDIIHRLPADYLSQYDHYYLLCDICHGKTVLASVTSKTVETSKSFFHRMCIEEWIQFETLSMCTVPREAVIVFTLWGINSHQSDSKQTDNKPLPKTVLGWCGIRLFTSRKELVQGTFLLGFWPADVPKFSGSSLSNYGNNCPLLQISLPEFGCAVLFPPVLGNEFASSQIKSFENLESHLKPVLTDLIERDGITSLVPDERELLWGKRYYLLKFPHALPKVLLSAHGWDWACLSDIYALLKEWSPLEPVDCLTLLLPCFPDLEVRHAAICWMKGIVSDELCDYLPQLVQVLRYETWDDSSTAWFLLERALTSVRVAHHLYWLLKQNLNDPVAGRRMQLMLNALLTISGRALRDKIEAQEALLENLSSIAENVKTTKESLRLSGLSRELEVTHHMLQLRSTCLPLSPSIEVCGVDVKSCSYFTSNTLPLKIAFHSCERESKSIETIYKVGDDLRQDMITLQMIRIMDKLWLKKGLDLKIVTFACVSTEYRKGMVEMVPESETLRKIQTELGLTGSFKDRPIAEWLQKYNTSELEYQQAVENFTLSCAGYCVATYVLGICDRHNDNIMLKTSGHIFHIDFGKFLGDSQMFGNIKRDRTPFVLTSDMAYVINGGDKPSKKFQYFIDLCSQAFNIIRKHKNAFFNLFMLMESSGIPGMSHNAVCYIQKALLPGFSEAEATAQFTRMIRESLKSWFTQFNFFIHNLAQLRFTGDHNEGLLLSFIPKTFTKENDGRIISVSIIGCKKIYDPEKYYMYIIKVERQNHPVAMCVFRTYPEFIEFHQKISMTFPLVKFHPLPGNPIMGRTNIREVADRRKSEIGVFLCSFMSLAEEISHCDLVYTFFHPLLRDQEGMPEEKETNTATTRSRRCSSLCHIKGQIKLSIVYKNNSLFIMIMHAKNLVSTKSSAPDPYVKTYLLPDPHKMTKRKTKTAPKNQHPTFMEMLVYDLPLEVVRHKNLHVSVWDYDRVQENEFLGATLISLAEADLNRERTQWYPLGNYIN